jgi:hypothetical protein
MMCVSRLPQRTSVIEDSKYGAQRYGEIVCEVTPPRISPHEQEDTLCTQEHARGGNGCRALLIVPIQMHFGWRASFYVFGIFGVMWAAGWWRWS